MSGAETIIILIFAVICALIAGTIGERKGIPGPACLLGFLLGPIGIILTLVAQGDRKDCPHCLNLIRTQAHVCSHCGRKVKAASSPPPAPPLPPAPPSPSPSESLPPIFRRCPGCSWLSRRNYERCQRCGASMEGAKEVGAGSCSIIPGQRKEPQP